MRRKTSRLPPQVGQWALYGTPGITMPSDWVIGLVLWTGKDDVLVEQPSVIGRSHRAIWPVANVIRAGDSVDLHRFRDRCAREVGALRRAVSEAETALDAARKAVWARLDDLADLEAG